MLVRQSRIHLNNKVSEFALNVRQFGAVGDGETDDTQAIQCAIDAAAAISGQVIFPPGVYACSTLHLKPHVTLTGCATWSYWYYKGSVIRLIDDQASCLVDATGAIGAVIDGLALDGLSSDHEHLGEGIHGIMLRNATFLAHDENAAFDDAIRIERSLVRNFSGDGIHLHNVCVFTVRSSMIANNLENGLSVRGCDGYVLDCWLSANRKAGYGAYGVNASVTMTANRIEWNRGGGIVIHGGNHYNITGNFLDRSGGPGIWLRSEGDERCHRFTITGNLIRRSGAHWGDLGEYANSQLCLDGCRGVVCTGNTLSIGQDDFEKGVFTPAYGIVYRDLGNCIIKDNVLHEGALKQLMVDLGHNDAPTTIVKDNIGSLAREQRG
jgi:hypothetical protein